MMHRVCVFCQPVHLLDVSRLAEDLAESGPRSQQRNKSGPCLYCYRGPGSASLLPLVDLHRLASTHKLKRIPRGGVVGEDISCAWRDSNSFPHYSIDQSLNMRPRGKINAFFVQYVFLCC